LVPVLDEPEPEVDPVLPLELGELLLGEVVLDDDPPVLPVLPAEEPPLELEPDLLKYDSHSVFDTCPSLFVSTAEKLGAEALELEPDMPPLPEDELLVSDEDEPDAPELELGVLDEDELGELEDPDPVVAAGDEELEPLAPVEPLLLPLVCAHAVVATKAAATAALISFNVIEASFEGMNNCAGTSANAVPGAHAPQALPAAGTKLPTRGSSFNPGSPVPRRAARAGARGERGVEAARRVEVRLGVSGALLGVGFQRGVLRLARRALDQAQLVLVTFHHERHEAALEVLPGEAAQGPQRLELGLVRPRGRPHAPRLGERPRPRELRRVLLRHVRAECLHLGSRGLLLREPARLDLREVGLRELLQRGAILGREARLGEGGEGEGKQGGDRRRARPLAERHRPLRNEVGSGSDASYSPERTS
jgi:hypothetical protein